METRIEKQQPEAIFLEEYDFPQEPQERTVQALVEYIIAQQAIIAKHNADKAALRRE